MFPENDTVTVRDLTIWPPVSIAPMVGLTHSCFRSLVQQLGGVGLLYTEMLAAKRLPSENPRFSTMLTRTADEHPLIYQIVAGNVDYISGAVDKLHQLGADGVDLNLGCPAPIQKRQGAGSFLTLDQSKLREILHCLRSKTDLPLSVKIRLGQKVDDEKLAETCKFYEDEGVDFITVHGRLNGEKFCRRPRWAAIAAAKQAVNVPVFANGGIFSVDDARRCLEQSGVDGLMLGRAVVEKPWLCSEVAREIYGYKSEKPTLTKRDVFFIFLDMLEDRFPHEKRLGRLKQFSRYYAESFKFGHHLTSCVLRSESMEEARERSIGFFEKTAPEELIIQ